LAAPVFQAIRDEYPEAKIEIVGNFPQIRLLLELQLVDQVFQIEDRRFLPLFAGNNFSETTLNFFRSSDAVLFWISNFSINLKDIPLRIVDPRPVPHPPLHHAQYLYNSVQSFLNLPAQDVTSFHLRDLLDGQPKIQPILLVHPGSGSPKKNWPLENFLSLSRKWKQKERGNVTFLFGPADANIRQEFQRRVPASEFSIIDSPNFEDLIKLIAAADFYLGNDSGISHLAGLLNKRGFVFFRTTNPKIWRPLGNRLHSIKIG